MKLTENELIIIYTNKISFRHETEPSKVINFNSINVSITVNEKLKYSFELTCVN